jgi:hypothetical protein
MRPKGVKETDENDMIWILKMDEMGEKVQNAI